MYRVTHYAIVHKNQAMLNDALVYLRNYFLQKGDLKGIVRLYQQDFPEAWATSDTFVRARLRAYIYDAADNVPAGDTAYRRALAALKESDIYNYAYLSLYYGKFLMRHNRAADAIEIIKDGYRQVAGNAEADFLMSITHELDTAYVLLHQYDSAYYYRSLYDHTAGVWNASVRSDEFLRQHLEAQAEARLLEAERRDRLLHDRHMAQYTFIVFAIGALLLIFALLSSFPVPRSIIRATGFFLLCIPV